MEEGFPRSYDSLSDIFDFAGRFITDHEIDASVAYSINLAVEELFTNMVKHNTGGGHPILIRMKVEDRLLSVQLIDEDVDPFDPSRVPDAQVDQPIEDRKIGGLGLHLVKSVVDKVVYEYKNRRMKVTIIKELER